MLTKWSKIDKNTVNPLKSKICLKIIFIKYYNTLGSGHSLEKMLFQMEYFTYSQKS